MPDVLAELVAFSEQADQYAEERSAACCAASTCCPMLLFIKEELAPAQPVPSPLRTALWIAGTPQGSVLVMTDADWAGEV